MYSILYVSESKIQIEVVSYFGDFTDVLIPGETITSQTVTVEVISGDDPNPSAMLYGGIDVHSGTIIEQRLQQGVIGCIYDIIFTVGTSAGNEYIKFTRLVILPTNWGVNPQLTQFYFTSHLYPYNIAAEGMQGYVGMSLSQIWLQPYFFDQIQGAITVTGGNLFAGSVSYSILPEAIQGSISMISGTLVQVVVTYDILPEAIQGNIAILSGNLFQSSVSYSILPEAIQGSITLISGSLF